MDTVKIGNKVIPVSGYKEVNGKKVPVIKAESEEIRHPDGRIDIIIKVPILKMEAKKE